MDAIQAILTRRSVRQFTNTPVPSEMIEKMIEAAMFAPSARNERPWQFLVVTDSKTLKTIPEFHPHAAMAAQASVGILLCADLSLVTTEGYWPQDCGAATENLLLAAHALGLGAVWTGIYPTQARVEGFRKKFNLPDHIIPLAFIPIGYPAQVPTQPDRFDRSRIHTNQW